ncbi:MAG TPA: hypothetical protein VN203_23420, partial [Candidatus Acidoferrum sp.]|nr:hypothetical protein [Candidatus Acidoferrum sp.]
QAGTLSGNPLAMAAGIETLTLLQAPGIYGDLEDKGQQFMRGFVEAATTAEVPVQVNRVGSMLTAFFTGTPVIDFDSAKTADTNRYAIFFQAMLERGVSLAPSQFEAAFISTTHTAEDLRMTAAAARDALRIVAAA